MNVDPLASGEPRDGGHLQFLTTVDPCVGAPRYGFASLFSGLSRRPSPFLRRLSRIFEFLPRSVDCIHDTISSSRSAAVVPPPYVARQTSFVCGGVSNGRSVLVERPLFAEFLIHSRRALTSLRRPKRYRVRRRMVYWFN